MGRHADRSQATRSAPLRVWVDRERARFGAWYEMFPRSAGPDPTRAARTFTEAAAGRLSAIADLGFDVVYLPPIHPIGRSFRKGPNNSLTARPGDPGSPWAIGSEEGGHTAIEPGLGTLDDFDAVPRRGGAARSRDRARSRLAVLARSSVGAASTREWFRHRPDGTIKYAENPPKKYQDIYPLDFACDDWRGLWHALLDGDAVLGRPGRPHLPRRQPAHQDVRVLGVADRRGACARAAGASSWPRRSLVPS